MKHVLRGTVYYFLISLLTATTTLSVDRAHAQGDILCWGGNVIVDQGALSDLTAIAGGGGFSLGLKADGSIVEWGGSYPYNLAVVPLPNSGFVAIAAGGGHALGLRADGSIAAWGRTYDGACAVPAPNTSFTAIAAGGAHSLGLKADGSVVAWGSNQFGQCAVPSPNTGFIAIAAGGAHSLGLKADGSIVAWGSNQFGQCTIPLPNTGFTAVAAGGDHSLGLTADTSILAWGSNQNGQCTLPSPNSGFTAIAAGSRFSVGLKVGGSIAAWGSNLNAYGNYAGQCTVPTPNTDFIAVAAGDYHSLGLKAEGPAVAWGCNWYGQCNLPPPNAGFVAVAAGGSYGAIPIGLGLRTDGSVVAWGDLGVPAPNTGFQAVASGSRHSLGLRQDGSIVAWGDNPYGQCTVPSPNANFAAVAAGWYHSLGLKIDGSVVAWGSNRNGYAGYYTGQCDVPSPNTDFTAVAAGGAHSLGLKSDGSIVAWGSNEYGQCTVPLPNENYTAVVAGYEFSLGLKTNGSVVAWGRNLSGACSVPAPNTGFTAIAAGMYHSLGLKADGSIVAWGQNQFGQCTVPTPNTNFVNIAAGGGYSVGLKRGASPVPELVVLSPGSSQHEFYQTPATCIIRWQYSGSALPHHYKIQYQTAPGHMWRTIAAEVNHGAQPQEYAWATPCIGADSLLVRVTACDSGGNEVASGTCGSRLVLADQYGVLLRHTHYNPDRPHGQSWSENKAVVFWPVTEGAASYRVDFAACANTTCGLDDPLPLGGKNVVPMPDGYLPHWLALSDEEFDGMIAARYTVTVTGYTASGSPIFVDAPRDVIVCHLEDHDYQATVQGDLRLPVLLVHGWTSNTSATWYSGSQSSFIDELRKSSSPRHVWSFEYPNIDAIRISACGLAEAVLYVRQLSQPTASKVSLLAHSMGGLVCRAYLQNEVDPPKDPLTYPPYREDVDRLATLSSPHLGGDRAGMASWLQDNVLGCAGANHSGSFYDMNTAAPMIIQMMASELPANVDFLMTAGTDYVGERCGEVRYQQLRGSCSFGNDATVTVCSSLGGHCQSESNDAHLNTGTADMRYRHYPLSHSRMANPGASDPLVSDVVQFLRFGASGVATEECPENLDEQQAELQLWQKGFSWNASKVAASMRRGSDSMGTQDMQSTVLPGARVQIRHLEDPDPLGGLVFITDARGRATVGLQSGAYRADFSAPGMLPRSEVFSFLPSGNGVSWPIELESIPAYTGPANPYIEINAGNAATGDSVVSVALYCERATQFMLSEDQGFDGAQWQPFVSSVSHVLEGSTGQKFLFSRFRSADGTESNTVSASIHLGTTALVRLSVTTTGGSARVNLDARDSGRRTPALFDSLAPGVHYVTVSEPGMVSDVATKVVVIAAGMSGSVNFALTALPPPPPVDLASLGSSDYWCDCPVSWQRPSIAGPGMLLYDVGIALDTAPHVPAWFLGTVADTVVALPSALSDSTGYVFRLTTRDARGGVQADSVSTRHFFLDRTPPQAAITELSPADSIAVGQTLTISLSATDWSGAQDLILLGSTDGGISYGDTLYAGNWTNMVMWLVPAGFGSHELRLKAACSDRAGNQTTVFSSRSVQVLDSVTAVADARATSFWFDSPHANPFSSATRLEFGLPREEYVEVVIYDLAGRRVRSLLETRMPAGNHALVWDGRDSSGLPLASGVYICRMHAGMFFDTKRVTIVK